MGMQSSSRSRSDHSALRFALIAFVCVVTGLLIGISPSCLAGTDGPARQIDNRVQQIEALNHPPVPMIFPAIRFAKGLHQELAEATDDDETERCLVRFDGVLPLHIPAFAAETGLDQSSADRALTPFRLRAFSTRGSPSA